MRKVIVSVLIIILLSCVFCTASFASGSENIAFSCYTTTNLTKSIGIEADSNVTVNWGDGSTEEVDATNGVFIAHTYSVTGKYNVSFSAEKIEKLIISNNDIVEIDFSQAVSLKEIDISNNKLESLDFSKNTLLENVSVSNNILNSITIVSDNLKQLNCSNNKITLLSVPNNVAELYINNNNISAIDLTSFDKLQVLECSDNNISSLNLSNSLDLKLLSCSNNFITSLSLRNNTKLEELYCYGNELEVLDISLNENLTTLNCIGNKLNSLDVTNNLNLEKMYVFRNQISNLDLGNINILRVIVDNTTTITNCSANTLISLETIGDGAVEINLDDGMVFSSIPNALFINDVEQTGLDSVLDISSFNGAYDIKVVFEEIEEEEYILVNAPQLAEGMIPVKHNGTNWVITNTGDMEWYNYSNTSLKWANAMLRDDAYYLDFDGKTLKSIGNTSLEDLIGREIPEGYTGSMYVWIPRFTYQISENDIAIKYSEGLNDNMENGFKEHPAFNYANYLGGDASDSNSYTELNINDKLLGFWVAKYPAGQNINNPKYTSNSTMLLNASIGEAFSASKLTSISSSYGLTNATSHMMKNTEWGAVAYFTSATGNLINDSTTGNIYGVYGMNDTAEYVSSFIELVGGISNFSVRKNGKSLLPYNIISYNNYEPANLKDIEIFKLKSATDNASYNYSILSSFDGSGITGVGSNITGNVTKNIPYGSNAFLIRGIDGIYSYSGSNGASSGATGFRNVILKSTSSNVDENTETYIIESTAGIGGTITPKGNTTVNKGSNITYSIIPETGSEIVDVIVDGNSVYNSLIKYETYATYQFTNINSNHMISVVFDSEIAPYQVTVETNPVGVGEVSGAGELTSAGVYNKVYNSRSTVTLIADGKTGYKFSSWEIKDGLTSIIDASSPTITFKMPNNNVILQANFIQVLKAMLKVENLYGSIAMEKDVGVIVNITAGENEEYVFDTWTATGIELTAEQLESSSIAIEMPGNDVKLIANYNKLYLVKVTLGDGTVIETYYPETKEVSLSAPQTVDGKMFSSWVVTGLQTTLPSTKDISFNMPSNNVEIKAIYSE